MDWPVTARTMVPHVRQTIADRELETWVVVDLSPSLDFGTARTEKRELALAALTAVVHLTWRGGNRVGAIVSTGSRPCACRREAARARAPPHEHHRLGASCAGGPAGRSRLDAGTTPRHPTARPGRRRLRLPRRCDWERPLRALSDRHQLLAIEILDPRELELPPPD